MEWNKKLLFSIFCASAVAGCTGGKTFTASTGAISGRAAGCEEVFYFPSNARNDHLVLKTFGSTESGIITQEFASLNDYTEHRAARLTSIGSPEGLQAAGCTRRSDFVLRNLEPGTYFVTTTRGTARYENRGGFMPGTGASRLTRYVVSSAMQRVVVEPGKQERVVLRPQRNSIDG